MQSRKVKASELQLADVVQLFEGPWGFGIVEQIRDGVVEIFRPYGASADFSCTSGVITYVGHEHVKYPVDSSAEHIVLWERKTLK